MNHASFWITDAFSLYSVRRAVAPMWYFSYLVVVDLSFNILSIFGRKWVARAERNDAHVIMKLILVLFADTWRELYGTVSVLNACPFEIGHFDPVNQCSYVFALLATNKTASRAKYKF